MHSIAIKVLITFTSALAVGLGAALFVIARQDGSKAGQILGVVIPVLAIISVIFFSF
jgi:hypothetical protein